jgi:hypothetical protein
MNRPSAKALLLGEELIDYVSHGQTRTGAIRELAELTDEANRDLVEAAALLVRYAELHQGVPAPLHVAHLKQVLLNYQAWPGLPDAQGVFTGLGELTQPHFF